MIEFSFLHSQNGCANIQMYSNAYTYTQCMEGVRVCVCVVMGVHTCAHVCANVYVRWCACACASIYI